MNSLKREPCGEVEAGDVGLIDGTALSYLAGSFRRPQCRFITQDAAHAGWSGGTAGALRNLNVRVSYD